jgi:UDP-glucuronate 4-epimerase
MKVLVTGSAGFIGYHTSKHLIDLGHDVIGLDNLNDYYDIKLKKDRIKLLQNSNRFSFHKIDLENQGAVELLFKNELPQRVIHLAAQAGVRYSIENPEIYVRSNIIGTFNIQGAPLGYDDSTLVY